jgi:hypothetical protein
MEMERESESTLKKETLDDLEVVVNFKHTAKFNINEESKLSELKSFINKEFSIMDDEYEIYINDIQLLIINQELKLKTLLETSNSNEFTIKSIKSKLLIIIYIYII